MRKSQIFTNHQVTNLLWQLILLPAVKNEQNVYPLKKIPCLEELDTKLVGGFNPFEKY